MSDIMRNSILAALLCGGVILTGCNDTAPTEQIKEYKVLNVGLTDKEIMSSYSAAIRGKQDINIYPQVSGTITEVCINEGERVRKGQPLFIIDQVPYKAALQVAEANVETAKAGVATAKLVFESKQALFDENVISQFDLSTAQNNLLTTQAQLSQAKAQEVNARNNLSYTVVKSPSDGVAGKLPFRVGALVGPTIPQALTTISDNSNMYVYFSMTENQLLGLTRRYGSKDSALQKMPPIKLQLNDKSLYEQEGRIESISGVIDQATGTVSLRAVFPNQGELLTSGGSGNVIIPERRTNCICIPQSITFELQDKVFVYKVADGKAQSAPIQVTRVNGGKEYIVDNGLEENDIIVAEGVGLLREGTPINVKQNQ